jgi:hypothetical protein
VQEVGIGGHLLPVASRATSYLPGAGKGSLDDKLLPATSNAVERGNRRYRKMQKAV